MAKHRLTDKAAWRVVIPEHVVQRRTLGGQPSAAPGYPIAQTVTVQFERSRRAAIRMAVIDAHVLHGVPSWRPYLRQTAGLASAERTVVSVGGPR